MDKDTGTVCVRGALDKVSTACHVGLGHPVCAPWANAGDSLCCQPRTGLSRARGASIPLHPMGTWGVAHPIFFVAFSCLQASWLTSHSCPSWASAHPIPARLSPYWWKLLTCYPQGSAHQARDPVTQHLPRRAGEVVCYHWAPPAVTEKGVPHAGYRGGVHSSGPACPRHSEGQSPAVLSVMLGTHLTGLGDGPASPC